MQREESVHVAVERRLGADANARPAQTRDASRQPPKLLSEVGAPAREVVLPSTREIENGTCLPSPQGADEQLGPLRVTPQLPCDEHVARELANRVTEQVERARPIFGPADGPELVCWAVPEEAPDHEPGDTSTIERQHRRQPPVGPARTPESQLGSSSAGPPPRFGPVGRGEDSTPRGDGEVAPLVGDALDPGDLLHHR